MTYNELNRWHDITAGEMSKCPHCGDKKRGLNLIDFKTDHWGGKIFRYQCNKCFKNLSFIKTGSI